MSKRKAVALRQLINDWTAWHGSDDEHVLKMIQEVHVLESSEKKDGKTPGARRYDFRTRAKRLNSVTAAPSR